MVPPVMADDIDDQDYEDIEDIEHISIAKLYNSVVDGLAGHLIVDTRSADGGRIIVRRLRGR